MPELSTKLDSQQIELFGRHRVIESMAKDGIEIAMPLRDRGVDFVAYDDQTTYLACPVQLKIATNESFSIHDKYAAAARLMMCYVWNIHDARAMAIYAMSWREALGVADAMEWTKTKSWTDNKSYSTSAPSKKLKGLIEPFRVRPGGWKSIIQRVATG